ncbi:MAG: hypothetical protein JWM27_3527 [Gemmatimonadetes bacterium]|nr:hypothetical protein [Gemmatimonadota bacterium]
MNEPQIARTPVTDGRPLGGADPSLGDLFRQLAEDSATLIRQEVALAKTEMKDNVQHAAKNASMVAVGGVVAAIGALVLVAFLVMIVGKALGAPWAGALVVGLLFVIAGAVLAKRALGHLKHDSLAPENTIQSLKEDKQWVQTEMQQARRELA